MKPVTLTELKLMVPGPMRSDLPEAELTREELAIDDEGDEGDSSGEQNRFDLIRINADGKEFNHG